MVDILFKVVDILGQVVDILFEPDDIHVKVVDNGSHYELELIKKDNFHKMDKKIQAMAEDFP